MGARLRIAANHWKLAIDTHAANFPHADHDCADISQVEPRRYPSTDVLLASPECTHHSQARSVKHQRDLFNPDGDPAAERSRATMWDVPRFIEQHRYKTIVVENVVEISKWPPFDAWLQSVRSYGYEHKLVSLNSMVATPPIGFARAPQSRDRVYVVFWRSGDPAPDLDIRPSSWCWSCEGVVEAVQSWKRPDRSVGRYRQQYVYRCPTCAAEASPLVSPAATAIDWTMPCPRIGDRVRPLSAATLRRIEIGLERFAAPILAQAAGHTFERNGYARVWGMDEPVPTQTTTLQHALVVPLHHSSSADRLPHTSADPWPTQTARQDIALVVPMRTNGMALDPRSEALRTLTTSHGGGHHVVLVPLRRNTRATRPDREPLPTVTAGGNQHAVVVVKNYGDGNDASMTHAVDDPLGTVTTQDHHSLVAVPFLTSYYGNGGTSGVDEPVPTVTTHDRHGLVNPSIDVDDCGFRMLEPPEIGRAMAFPDEYRVEGTKRDRVKLYGNAVTPPATATILERCVAALA